MIRFEQLPISCALIIVLTGCSQLPSKDALLDADSDGYDFGEDCNDGDSLTYPGANETCDEVDNDCDGITDEDDAEGAITWYADEDDDGYGATLTTVTKCYAGVGYTSSAGDCNDTDADISPASAELCDGIDNNCDGVTDEAGADGASAWYIDEDGDGFGDPESITTACTQPDGYVAVAEDCDDTKATVHAGAAELCDELDNDCDGKTDEDDAEGASTWYSDLDGDGYGDPDSTTTACTQPAGYTDLAGDCDDTDSEVNPVGAEQCDDIDNDCDGATDEDDTEDPTTWYSDTDGDGYGDEATWIVACSRPSGYDAVAGDCDDEDASVYPGAEEICDDGVVNDCDSDAATATEDCGPSGALGLAATDIQFVGEAASDYAGSAVSGAGDVDGDGLDDLVIGARGESSGGSFAGAAYLLRGGDALLGTTGTLDLSSADFKLTGEDTNDNVGLDVSGVGDADGDGLDDVLVGAYGDSDGGSSAGAAYLLLGGGSLYGASGTRDISGADFKITGVRAYDFAGYAIAGAGDTDDDDLADLVIGAYGNDDGGTSAGVAYLLLGSSIVDASSSSLDLVDANLTLSGCTTSDYAGFAVSGSGDVDADGLDDILIGAYGEDSGGSSAGAAYLLLGGGALAGASGTVSLADADLDMIGSAADDRTGYTVSGAGDVDGDGQSDLLVGAYREDTGGADAGMAFLLLGGGTVATSAGTLALSGADVKLSGASAGDYASWAVSDAGDVDGDDLDDLLVGAWKDDTGGSDAGATYLLFGSGTLSGATGTISLSTADLILTGESAYDYAGAAASSIGDMNGDLFDDLLVGAYGEDSGGSYGGSAYLMYGGSFEGSY